MRVTLARTVAVLSLLASLAVLPAQALGLTSFMVFNNSTGATGGTATSEVANRISYRECYFVALYHNDDKYKRADGHAIDMAFELCEKTDGGGFYPVVDIYYGSDQGATSNDSQGRKIIWVNHAAVSSGHDHKMTITQAAINTSSYFKYFLDGDQIGQTAGYWWPYPKTNREYTGIEVLTPDNYYLYGGTPAETMGRLKAIQIKTSGGTWDDQDMSWDGRITDGHDASYPAWKGYWNKKYMDWSWINTAN
jgi:hypothetical protein